MPQLRTRPTPKSVRVTVGASLKTRPRGVLSPCLFMVGKFKSLYTSSATAMSSPCVLGRLAIPIDPALQDFVATSLNIRGSISCLYSWAINVRQHSDTRLSESESSRRARNDFLDTAASLVGFFRLFVPSECDYSTTDILP